MSYSTREDGISAIPDRDTGPVTRYHIANISGNHTRAFNRTEREKIFSEIDDAMETEIEAARERAAQKYLSALRQILDNHDLRNHDVKITAGMGSVSLQVNGRYVSDYRKVSPVVDRLQEIDQMIEGAWDWAAYLDNVSLTHY